MKSNKHMKNKNSTVWSTRFKNPTSKIFEQIGASIDTDKRLFEEDILGSIVHTQMLIKQKIINKKRGKKIINALKRIKTEINKGKFSFSKKYEDIHLNIEKRLFSIIGNQEFSDKLKNKDLQSDVLKKLVELMPGIIWKKKENSF